MRALVLLASLAACAELPDLGVCGNGIVEASLGEACDGSERCTASCEVACGAEDTCEDGQTCGTDKVCRAPSGSFALVGTPQLFDVTSMLASDFDVDGIADLAGTSATQIAVLYGSSTATPLTSGFTQDLPISTSPPVIYERDIVSAEASKFAIAIPTDGIALMISDAETFQPKIEGPFVVDAAEKGIAVVEDPDPLLGNVVVEFTDRQQLGPIKVRRLELPGAIAGLDLPDCAPSARVLKPSVTRDGSLVLALGFGDPTRWRVCEYRDFGDPIRTTINSPIPSSLVLANVDADACEEIVAARHVGADTIIEIIDAAGTPCTLATTATPLTDGTLVGTNTEVLTSGPVLSQQRDAIVLANGVYVVTAGNVLVRMTPPMMDQRWGVAAVVDLNRDGFGDVVASLREQQNLEVVRGSPAPGLSSYVVSTAVRVVAMRPGDFDGDGYGDVAVAESGASGNERISVLYGRADGVVASPRSNSRFQGIVRFLTLRNFGWGNTVRGRDGIDDLFVVRSVRDQATQMVETRVGVLVGDASRVMTMPQFPDEQVATVGTLAVGRIAGDTVSAVAVRPTSSSSSEILAFDLASTITPVPLPGLVADETRPGAVLRTNASPLIAVVTKAGPRAFTATGVQCTGAPELAIVAVHPVDVDGDGFDELAVLDDSTRRVRVYEVTGGTTCAFGAELLRDALEPCFDVARIGATVVAVCAKTPQFAAALYRIVDGVRDLAPVVELDAPPFLITPGDYDGDGVTDLAIGVNRGGIVSVHVVRQCPAHDMRGCR